MKRFLTVALVIALLCALFAGCTPAPKDPTDTTTGTEDSVKPSKPLTVGSHELNAALLNYHYMDVVTTFCNNFSDYGEYADLYLQMYTGLDLTAPLSQQVYDEETGDTWADYFIAEAVRNAHWTYAMYDAAVADGFALSEEQQKQLDNLPSTIELYATYMGMKEPLEYLQYVYGKDSDLESYLEYYRIAFIANLYAQQHYENLEFTSAELEAYEQEGDRHLQYDSYTYATYYISVSKYLKMTHGTASQYTDEQKAAAIQAAKAVAETIASKTGTLDSMNLAILQANLDSSLFASSATESQYELYSKIPSYIAQWLANPSRSAGDATVLENATDDSIDGYYVVLFTQKDENKIPFANVQHILLTAKTVDERDAALEKAGQILEEFRQMETQDSAAFASLVKKYTEDLGSKETGGLIDNICRNRKYVQNFEDWALAGHNPGDTGIVETEYGIHIMYYKEDGAITYRESLIAVDLRYDTQAEWEAAIMEKVTMIQGDTSCLNADLVLRQ